MSRFPWKTILSGFLVAGSLANTSSAVRAGEISSELAQATSDGVIGEMPAKTYEILGEPLKEAFNRAFFHNTGRFYEITDMSGQANNIFGWRSFPGSFFDNQIADDGLILNAVFLDAMKQQSSSSRIITRDLPNPFDASLQENPGYSRFEGAVPDAGSNPDGLQFPPLP